MPRIAYIEKRFNASSVAIIEQANEIIEAYREEGYVLTLRQLYYQFVARDLIPNTQKEYKRLGSIINDARLAGHIDWEAIEDRTRSLDRLPHWDSPQDILEAVAGQYRTDKWANQHWRVEVWIEKEALAGVFESACVPLEVPFLSCRGYGSQSVMWRAARRLMAYERAGQEVRILHFGDHDPSGIDMTRDIQDRLRLFGFGGEVLRVALNMDQVREHKPPPNPAKVTDSRSTGYIAKYGAQSWELDALEPAILSRLVRDNVAELVDSEQWDTDIAQEETVKDGLQGISEDWEGVLDYLELPA
jgi:hypothetical protein